MSGQWNRQRNAVVLLIAACVLAAAVAPAVVAGGNDGSDGIGDTVGTDAAAVESAQGDDPTDRTAVGPGLRSTNGTVEVVVRFAGDARVGTSGAGERGSVSTNGLKTNAATAQAEFERFARNNPAIAIERSFWVANAMLVTVDTDRVPIDRILDVRGVERVHGNFEVELDSATATGADDGASIGATTDPESGPTADTASATSADVDATYGVDMVRAPEVWETFDARGAGATVAVIDTGIDPDHPDITVSGWAEYNSSGALVSEGPESAYDDDGHGTHVAGSVAGGNESGTAIGVAPEADLYGIKTFDRPGDGATFTQVLAGMQHATDDPSVDVLQLSLGAQRYSSGFIEPVRNARDAGKVVVASSGNGGTGTSTSPGNVYESLAVGAVGSNRVVADFSSGETVDTSSAWGSDAPADWPDAYVVPDVAAPGVSVNSSLPGGGYGRKSGTSMAAPHVSGVVALMISASSRTVSDEALSETLRDTANHPDDATDPDTRYGTGIVDGYAAASSITENRSTLTVTGFDAPAETVPGSTVRTSATVNNTGEAPGVGTVEYRFDGTVGNETTVSLDPGEEATVAFSYVVPENATTGESYDHGVYTNDSNLTAGISALDAPFYGVTNLTAPSIVERNATLEATATVVNRGGVAGENRTVELRLSDPRNESDVRTLDATTVSLGAGNATAVTVHGTVPDDVDTGETTLAVASADADERAAIRVAEAVGTVNGTVTDAGTDATLSGIDVTVRSGTEVVGETATEANGTYAIAVPATALNVTASNETYAPTTGSVTLGGTGDAATANLSLVRRNGTLKGIIGASDGLAVPRNATVTVRNGTGDGVAAVAVLADGTYALDLRPGTYDLHATAPDFDPRNETGITVLPNATTDGNAQLDPLPATVSGTVANGSDGEPIGGATVTIASATGTADTTADDGTYSLTVDRGQRTVVASAYGYADSSRALEVAANESRESNDSLAPEPVFPVRSVSGPPEVERGTSGSFEVAIENDGNAAGDATVSVGVSPSGTAESMSFTDVAAGERTAGSVDVSIDGSALTGTYEVVANTADDSRTRSFEVVSSTDDGGDGSGGGGGDSDGGDGGAGGGTAPPPSDDTGDEEPADDGRESGTAADATNGTADDATNETVADVTNETETENGTDEPVGDGGVGNSTDGSDDTADGGEHGNAGNDETVDGESDGDGDDGTDGTNGTTEPTGASEDETPGFGVGGGVLALVTVALLASRRTGWW